MDKNGNLLWPDHVSHLSHATTLTHNIQCIFNIIVCVSCYHTRICMLYTYTMTDDLLLFLFLYIEMKRVMECECVASRRQLFRICI